MYGNVETSEQVARVNETIEGVKAPMLVELGKKERPRSKVGNIDLVAKGKENEERPLNQAAEEICKVDVVRQNQEAQEKEGKGREKERDKKRLSKALKQAVVRLPRYGNTRPNLTSSCPTHTFSESL